MATFSMPSMTSVEFISTTSTIVFPPVVVVEEEDVALFNSERLSCCVFAFAVVLDLPVEEAAVCCCFFGFVALLTTSSNAHSSSSSELPPPIKDVSFAFFLSASRSLRHCAKTKSASSAIFTMRLDGGGFFLDEEDGSGPLLLDLARFGGIAGVFFDCITCLKEG